MRDRRRSSRSVTEGQAELALSHFLPKRRRRYRYVDPRQLAFVFEFERRSFRAIVLAVVNASTGWTSAHDIAARAHLTYLQTIFALVALHNRDKIARTGRKATAKWGPLSLVAPPGHNFSLLQSLFNTSIKRDPSIK